MGCAAALKKQAGLGLLAGVSNMSSREFQIKVWEDRGPVETVEGGASNKTLAEKAQSPRHPQDNENVEPCGHVDLTEACGQMGGGYGISKQREAQKAKAHPHRHLQDKENVNPSGLSDSRPSSLPSWHQRYPLQDITAIIHSLQGLQVDIDAGLALSGWSKDQSSAGMLHASTQTRRADNCCSLYRLFFL